MERNLLNLVKNNELNVDMSIVIPASKEESFLEKYEKHGWSSEKAENVTTVFPNTVRVRTARKLYNNLPDYAKVSSITIYPKNPDASYFYTGPVTVDENGLEHFMECWLKAIEKRVKRLEN